LRRVSMGIYDEGTPVNLAGPWRDIEFGRQQLLCLKLKR